MFRQDQIKTISLGSQDYPFLLSQIPSPPAQIFAVGNLAILKQKSLSVVGSRKMSLYGKRAAEKFTRQLVEAGWVIISGLARGIDGVVHKACLEAKGKTVAVLGNGLDNIYPPEHRPLAEEIVAMGGCLVTEFSWQFPIERKNFILRDRIMAGLSLGTLVIEGGKKSGTKITAGFAADYGREVFCVPGPIDSPTAVGPAELIQQGAKLVTKVEDIEEEFNLK